MPEQTTDDAVVIERLVNSTIDGVWAMWTEPSLFGAWYGPAGATCDTVRFDLRPGGERAVAMTVQIPSGERTMWFVGEHLEVVEPVRLAYTEVMTDRDGGDPQGPVTSVRVELTEEDGGTRFRLTHHGIPAGSPGATGWQMAFDKLEALLS